MKDEKPGKSPETTSGEDQPIPTATPTTQARRRLLKRLATGSGVVAAGGMLPQKWTAPMVQSVLLPAHATSTPTPNGDAGCCSGQVCQLTLKYSGTSGNIKVTGHQGATLFDDNVNNGAEFSFTGNATSISPKMGSNIELEYPGGCQGMHTSCSAPIGPGTICGVFEVISGMATGDGGSTCSTTLSDFATQKAECPEFDLDTPCNDCKD